MSTVITVENLGKKYTLRHQSGQQPYVALRDVITERAAALGRKLLHPFSSSLLTPHSSQEEFWALKDVSFEVKQGDRIGIIGRNGAGKSTLLKILSRIIEPTTGSVRIRGRVASLLEVGTGFHPELTGRENIYLNGAILGMHRAEIKKKFDEIVDFAEIEKFLDTPVKRYSSGMYVRLAFAVAAHLDPEIFVVDEVLAVGDAQFQKKCLGKMEEVSVREGITVLFVSHNMGTIGQFCAKGILMDAGSLEYNGTASEAVSRYLARGSQQSDLEVNLENHPNRMPGMRKLFKNLTIKNEDLIPTRNFTQLEAIRLEVEYGSIGSEPLAGAGFIIYSQEGVRVGGGNTYMSFSPPHRVPSSGKVRFFIPARQFTPGFYSVTVSLGSHQGKLEDKIENAINFNVLQADVYGTGYLLTKEDGVAALTFETAMEAV